VLQRVKKERIILQTIKRWKDNWIINIFRWNCLIKPFTEGNIEGISDGKTKKKM
jgi:hypothetical protein